MAETTKHLTLDNLAEELPNGIQMGWLQIGPEGSDAPVIGYSKWPPGRTVPPHTHSSDYVEIILEGSQRIGKTWHKAGDVRMVKAGTGYGPLTAGPEGVTFLVVFATGDHYATLLPQGTEVRDKLRPMTYLD